MILSKGRLKAWEARKWMWREWENALTGCLVSPALRSEQIWLRRWANSGERYGERARDCLVLLGHCYLCFLAGWSQWVKSDNKAWSLFLLAIWKIIADTYCHEFQSDCIYVVLIFFQPFAKLCKIFENILTAAAFTLEANPGMQSDLSHGIPGSQ